MVHVPSVFHVHTHCVQYVNICVRYVYICVQYVNICVQYVYICVQYLCTYVMYVDTGVWEWPQGLAVSVFKLRMEACLDFALNCPCLR